MENKIQELTDKIYREGVEKGNEEAQRLIGQLLNFVFHINRSIQYYYCINYVPSSDSRQIYKNQFDKKGKDEKKNIPLQKNHTSTPILFRFQRILITK